MLRGIYREHNEKDVVQFLKGFNLDENDVVLEIIYNGKFSGKALVFFKSEADVKKAKEMYDKKYLGGRYIEFLDQI